MNKALPWNVNGVGFDAREAARDAARRQGKSLGEWLHGVISDHATDIGVDENEIDEQRRIDAVTSRLERLGSERRQDRKPEFKPRLVSRDRRDEQDEDRPRTTRRDEDDMPPVRRRSSRAIDDTDRLLEDAIDAMERRATRVERHTDDALDSFAKMLERNEARRERERSSVFDLAEKLSSIEARLSERHAQPDDNPIRSALTRLEARLDTIGRRGAAEAAAHRSLATPPASASSEIGRFEEKLNAILEVVHGQSGSLSTAALAAAHVRPPRQDRRLGEAIADISKRQRSLEDGPSPISLHDAILRRRDPAPRRSEAPPEPSPFAAMHAEIATLSERIESLRHDVSSRPQPLPPQPSPDLEALRMEVGSMASALRDLGRNAARDIPIASPPPALTKIEDRLDELSTQIHRAVSTVSSRDGRADALVSADFMSLETLVRDLSERIDSAQAPGAGHDAIDALQAQIARLSSRFDTSETGFGKLASLERSMQDLFAHLEQTRAIAETSAVRAAHEAVKVVIEETGGRRSEGGALELAAMKTLQSEAEARTSATLSAVHETLEKVVDRLALMEGDIARVRDIPKLSRTEAPRPDASAAVPRPRPAVRPQARDIPLAAPEPMLESSLGQRSSEAAAKASRASFDVDDGPADFIAAARRAARAAQSDPAVAELKRPAAETPVRAGLAEQSRDYVARHKRPVLLGIAALFMIMGTMAIMQRIGATGGESQLADMAAPARIERAFASADTKDALTPSALPKKTPAIAAQISGSDPLPTASIPSLPAFAAQGAGRAPAPQPVLPPGLTTMAKSGDAAAEYVLAAQYTEGRTLPRDFKLAAEWFQKAADQGIVPAQYRLASLYEKGLGVGQDKAKAKSLYTQAAEAGNPRAMHNLAVLLADGDGHPDYEGAATWFRKAAQFGIHDSQYNLAILLARGLGVQQSMVQSYQWFAVAATQNDSDAAKKRDEVGARLAANDLAVAKALAASFRPRIADIAATEVSPPPGGWDSAAPPSSLNSPRQKISSL